MCEDGGVDAVARGDLHDAFALQCAEQVVVVLAREDRVGWRVGVADPVVVGEGCNALGGFVGVVLVEVGLLACQQGGIDSVLGEGLCHLHELSASRGLPGKC